MTNILDLIGRFFISGVFLLSGFNKLGNYGFNSIWVNRNNSIFDNLDYKPQNEIKNLSELIKII